MSPTLLVVLSFSLFAVAFPTQKIEAEEGDNVILQCLLDPQVSVLNSTVEWSKDGRKNIVHLYILGRDRAGDQKKEFRNRTILFHEGLKRGNVTLQLSSVQVSDNGTYRCYIRRLNTYCYTVLNVVQKGQLNRSRGNDSNRTRHSLDEVPKPKNPDGENRSAVCVDVLYTVFGIFCIVLGVVIGMILGTIWVRRKIHGRRGRQTGRTTNNLEMQNLRTNGREGGEHLASGAENGSGNVQPEV